MHFFFADDSRVQGLRRGMGRLIAFGGILLRAEQIQALEDGVARVFASFEIPPETEFKYSFPRDNWIRENLDADQQETLRRDLLRTLSEAQATAIVSVIDTGRTYYGEERAREDSVKYVFERVTTCLDGGPATIVADRPGGGRREEDEFLQSLWGHVREGTDFVRPDSVRHADTSPSRFSRPLQLADLVCGITTGVVSGESRYAPPLFRYFVHPMLIRNYRGSVGGTGLKLFPDDLVNLYYWILGERHYVRIRQLIGARLPMPGFPYHEDDGCTPSAA